MPRGVFVRTKPAPRMDRIEYLHEAEGAPEQGSGQYVLVQISSVLLRQMADEAGK